MTKEQYDKLRETEKPSALYIDLLNASGFAGVLPSGGIVDRRYYPDALPIQQNSIFGVSKPKLKEEISPYSVELPSSEHPDLHGDIYQKGCFKGITEPPYANQDHPSGNEWIEETEGRLEKLLEKPIDFSVNMRFLIIELKNKISED